MSSSKRSQSLSKRQRPCFESDWGGGSKRTLPGFLGPPFRVVPPPNVDHDDWDLYVPEEYPSSIPDIEKMQQLWEGLMSSVEAAQRAISQAEEVLDANKRAASAVGQCLWSLGIPIPQQGHGLMERYHPFFEPAPTPPSPPRPSPRPLKLRKRK
jgi:hypothetical protein